MNGNSKSEKVASFIRARVRAALKERGYEDPDFGTALRCGSTLDWIARDVADRVVAEYSLMELNDIMHWKKPKSAE